MRTIRIEDGDNSVGVFGCCRYCEGRCNNSDDKINPFIIRRNSLPRERLCWDSRDDSLVHSQCLSCAKKHAVACTSEEVIRWWETLCK
jgi:hypothetical protein